MPFPQTPFDHEKLDVYQFGLQFTSWTTALVGALRESRVPHIKEVVDQLERAALSLVLNIAEGNGRRTGQARAKSFDDARGSGIACAACLDVLVAHGACAAEDVSEGKALLLRIVAMVCKLVDRFDEAGWKEAR